MYQQNTFVWAKQTKKAVAWPAKVAQKTDHIPAKPLGDNYWLYFYGTNKFDWVDFEQIEPWEENLARNKTAGASQKFASAVTEAFEEWKKESGGGTVNVKVLPVPKGKAARKKTEESDSRFEKIAGDVEEDEDSDLVDTDKILGFLDKHLDEVSSKNATDATSEPKKRTRKRKETNVISETASPKKVKETGSTKKKIVFSEDVKSDIHTVKPFRKKIDATNKVIGFIGLGNIGKGLVENLLRAGHTVFIWNRNPQKCDEAKKLGASLAISAADVASHSDIIFCCVSDQFCVRDVLQCTQGVLNKMVNGKGFINLTSTDPTTSAEFNSHVHMRGGKYLEAPLLGSKRDSEDGSLLVLTAGDEELFREAESCFDAFGKKAVYLGEVGKASELQIIMNMLYGNCMSSIAEALALCRKSGVDRNQLISVLRHSDLSSPFFIEKANQITGESSGFPLQKALKHQQKDLKMALMLGDQLVQALPVTAAAGELFKRAMSWGHEDNDVAAVYKAACL